MTGNGAGDVAPELRTLAARQWQDYRARTPGTYFAEAHDALTIDEAYAVQGEVARLRSEAGDVVAGYKVGCIGPAVVELFGMSGTIYGRLFRGELQASGKTLQYGDYVNLAIEGEMAVRIGADGSITAAFPVIELHNFIFRGARKTLVELVANNGVNAGVVLAHADMALPLDDWAATRAQTITVNGRVIDSGDLWGMAGGAAEAVSWLQESLGRHGGSLAPGDLVLTGTPLGLFPVEPGQRVSVSVDGVERVTCEVV